MSPEARQDPFRELAFERPLVLLEAAEEGETQIQRSDTDAAQIDVGSFPRRSVRLASAQSQEDRVRFESEHHAGPGRTASRRRRTTKSSSAAAVVGSSGNELRLCACSSAPSSRLSEAP